MVFCRNVLIYFDKELQERVFDLIYYSLVRKCFLILGESENIEQQYKFEKLNKLSKTKIFRKVETI
jgi:chemotaxis protein methyltransferase CheR